MYCSKAPLRMHLTHDLLGSSNYHNVALRQVQPPIDALAALAAQLSPARPPPLASLPPETLAWLDELTTTDVFFQVSGAGRGGVCCGALLRHRLRRVLR
jgi:hypothetical protein